MKYLKNIRRTTNFRSYVVTRKTIHSRRRIKQIKSFECLIRMNYAHVPKLGHVQHTFMDNSTNAKPEGNDEESTESEPYMIMPDAHSSSMYLVVEGSEVEKNAMTQEQNKQKDDNVVVTSQCCILI